MISTDEGTVVLILLLIQFKVETDVGIKCNFCSSLDFQNAFRFSRFDGSDLGPFLGSLFFRKISTEDSNRCIK